MEQRENLNFGQALAALKQGKKVARGIWGGFWVLAKGKVHPKLTPEQLPLDAPMVLFDLGYFIVASLKEGGYAPAQPYQADLLAEDWKILD